MLFVESRSIFQVRLGTSRRVALPVFKEIVLSVVTNAADGTL